MKQQIRMLLIRIGKMAVKKLRPITPGQRFRIAPVFEEITKAAPEKSLLETK